MEGANMDLPIITIVMTTYFPDGEDGKLRKEITKKTLDSWGEFLVYEGDLNLHLADDGSAIKHIDYPYLTSNWWWNDYSYSIQERHGVGASLNAGFKKSFETSPLVLYAVDDWSLTQSFDLTPWAQLLMEREDVGVVRFSPPHPNIRGHVEAFTENIESWALRLDRYGFAFGHRPALYHRRFLDFYGEFKENCSALECEKGYNDRYCARIGPDVVMALPSPFRHLDSVELAYLEP